MEITQKIVQFISEGSFDKAIELLDRAIEKSPDNAHLWYLRGRTYWRLGNKAAAISDYEESAHLDPKSPAVHALEIARGIMDFYNPDFLNP